MANETPVAQFGKNQCGSAVQYCTCRGSTLRVYEVPAALTFRRHC